MRRQWLHYCYCYGGEGEEIPDLGLEEIDLGSPPRFGAPFPLFPGFA